MHTAAETRWASSVLLGALLLSVCHAVAASPAGSAHSSSRPGGASKAFSKSSSPCAVTWRKDWYADQEQYQEFFWHDPVTGGRATLVCDVQAASTSQSQWWPLHFAAKVASSGTWFNATIQGSAQDISAAFDSISGFYAPGSALVGVSFHTQDASLLANAGGSGYFSRVVVTTAGGTTLVNTGGVSLPPIGGSFAGEGVMGPAVRYLTTQSGYREAVLHLEAPGSSATSVTAVELSIGSTATNKTIQLSMVPHQRSVVVVPLSAAAKVGDAFALRVTGPAGASAWTGWIVREGFTLNSWSKSYDCDLPGSAGGDQKHLDQAWSIGINNQFYPPPHKCPDHNKAGNLPLVLEQSVAANSGVNGTATLVVSCTDDRCKDMMQNQWPYDKKGLPEALTAWYGCDECDKPPTDGKGLAQWRSFQKTRDFMYEGPGTTQETIGRTPTLLNGHSSKCIGTYEGMAAIVSMDFYVAGCAPHVTAFDNLMRVLGALRYIDAARINHRPQTTWGYSQWAAADWDDTPYAVENVFQVGSAVAAGSKGLLLFQQDYTTWNSGTYSDSDRKLMKDALQKVRIMADAGALREGDVRDGWTGGVSTPFGDKCDEGSTWSPDDSDRVCMVRVIESPKYLLVVVLNSQADGYNSISCAVKLEDHWSWEDLSLDHIDVELPGGRKLDLSNGCLEPDPDSGKLVPSGSVVCEKHDGSGLKLKKVLVPAADPVSYFLVPFATSTAA